MDGLTIKNDTLETIYQELDRDPRIKSEHTKRGYRADLAEFETWRSGRKFTRLLVGEYASQLQEQGKAPSTINRKLAALRWYARRVAELAHEADMTDPETRREIIAQAERVASVPDVTGERHNRPGRSITAGEIEAVIRVCQADGSPAGARDAAMFALLRAGGLRRAELVGLAMGDIRPGEGDTCDLLVHGKGDKTRIVPVNNGAYLALRDWLQVRGDQPGAVFCVIRKGGALEPEHGLSGDAWRQIQDKRCEAAKVPHITTHDWRRTFAGDLLDQGADIVTVAGLMGHEQVSTTARYDRRGDAAKRRAVRGLFVPYKPREVD